MQKYRTILKISYFKLFWGILTIDICVAQGITQNIRYELESGIYLSTSGQNPFWLRSNQYGIVPLESQFLTLRGAARKEYDSTKNEQNKQKRFSYGYGLNTVVNVGKANQIILPEAYLKVRYGAFELYGGRKREIIGLVDTMLTSGSYIWSGNALPMPKLQISIPNYVSIIGKGLVSIKGAYSHGWFGSSDSTRNFFLHQKYLYGRIGKPNWKIKMYAGFNHQVQWGGRPTKPYIEKETGKLITNYGNDFNSYLSVISGISLNRNFDGLSKNGIPINDALNRAGNHLGSIDIATEINFNKFDILLYRQSIYEDGSLYYLGNITDGLLGVSFKRKRTKSGLLKFVFEYINTNNQGGPGGNGTTIPQIRGSDNYFNNSFYHWVYSSNTIGTPLLMPLNEIQKEIFPNYSITSKAVPQSYIVNNHVSGMYLAVSFVVKNKLFITKLSQTNNAVEFVPIKLSQFSALQVIQFKFKQYFVNSEISFDSNALFKKNVGVGLSLKRIF